MMCFSQKTELAFKSEVHVTSDMVSMSSDSDVNKVLSAYKSDGDPNVYKDAYADLMKFVENSLDIYKVTSSPLMCFLKLPFHLSYHFPSSMNLVPFCIQCSSICTSSWFIMVIKTKQ